MLTKMYLTNFLSFSQKTEFDFTASKSSILSNTNTFENNLLKGALFIGANASGKSNALKGIGLLINLINGLNLKGISLGNYRCFFAKSPITKIEYEFIIEGKKINYEISFDVQKKEIQESLLLENESILFRSGSRGELHLGESSIEENDLDPDTLFLRTASFNTGRFPQEPILRSLMNYLLSSRFIDGYNQSAILGRALTKYAEENGVEKINSYLSEFNYGFSIEYGEESQGEGLHIFVGSNNKSIFFKRNSYPIPNIFIYESQGNQVFADLLPQLIGTIEQPGMLVIDEFGNSFHNRLAEKIIRFFMEKAQNSQFFITSHDTNLISNSVFRPDQINVITFEGKNGSKVKRVSQYKPREAQNLEKMYLGGMFEGLPIYD